MVERDPASFRDPSGHVFQQDGRILRTVTARAASAYDHLRETGLLEKWIDRGWVVGTREVEHGPAEAGVHRILEHDRIPFISYPYEWSFAALQAGALLHLDLQIDALPHGIQLSDASAYNIQFDGARPVFIDILSFIPYREGDYWMGHWQFVEQFLNPLLLRALAGVPHNAWFRGTLEGITSVELNALLPASRKLSLAVFSHVTLPARLARQAANPQAADAVKKPRRPLPRASYVGLLKQLRAWIARLEPAGGRKTTWSDYETTHTYSERERQAKHEAVSEFVRQGQPATLWEFGCNAGEYSQVALESGAARAIGFETDHGALERAFARARDRRLPFLPLYMDAANPSPDQGWAQRERPGVAARGPADMLLALAFIHHLAIGRNVPLAYIAAWLTSCARSGVIEFVQKADPTVQLMLSTRQDIFDMYTEESFAAALANHARIVGTRVVSDAGRTLYFFET